MTEITKGILKVILAGKLCVSLFMIHHLVQFYNPAPYHLQVPGLGSPAKLFPQMPYMDGHGTLRTIGRFFPNTIIDILGENTRPGFP